MQCLMRCARSPGKSQTGRVRLVHCLHHHGSTYKELCRSDGVRKDLLNWVNNLLQRAASSTEKGDSSPRGTTGTDQDCIGRWEAP